MSVERAIREVIATDNEIIEMLNERITRLTEALEKYGKHDHACNYYLPTGEDTQCDCGLTAAITEMGEP